MTANKTNYPPLAILHCLALHRNTTSFPSVVYLFLAPFYSDNYSKVYKVYGEVLLALSITLTSFSPFPTKPTFPPPQK